LIYDIFGFFPQTLQGADILALSDKDNQYQVFIPGKPSIWSRTIGNDGNILLNQ
jgi:hypothetical protein